MSRFYDDLDTFFTARGLRRAHENSTHPWLEDSYDYGVWWRGQGGSVFRLTWIGDTHRDPGDGGELYFVRLSGPHVSSLPDGVMRMSAGEESGMVELLCVIKPFPDGSNPACNVEAILDGWAEVCGQPDSTEWVRDRAWEALRAGWATET